MMRFSFFLGCLAVLLVSSTVRAQFTPTHLIPPTSGMTSFQCLHERPCSGAGSCADAGASTCMSVTNGAGTSGGICVANTAAEIYCCALDAATVDCPLLPGMPAPTCRPVMGLVGAPGICDYGNPYCTDSALTTGDLPQVVRCYTPPGCTLPPVMMTVPWNAGDCDGDCTPNGSDPCPCDGTLACGIPDAGPPDLGLPDLGAPDLGVTGTDGGGTNPDLGNTSQDLGSDTGATPTDAGSTAMDATGPTPDLGGSVTFRGTGGCNCTVATPASGHAGLLALLLGGVLPLARRLRKRAR